MKKHGLLFRIARRVKRLFFPPPSAQELRRRKQLRDYEFLKSHGVDTQLGFVELFGDPLIYIAPGARIVMEEGVVLISGSEYNWAGINHPVVLSANDGAEIILHKGVGISGSSIVAVEHVEIGENTKLGANTNVYDTDFHPVIVSERLHQKSILDAPHAPVNIGKNCWLASNVTVLKGVTLGENVVVSTMSLVNRSASGSVLLGGIPAKVIKEL